MSWIDASGAARPTGGTIVLGRLYYREVAKGFQQLSHAANVLARARNESGIVLSALSSVASRWVSRKIFDWQSLCPGSNVRILGQEQEPRLGAEEVDFRITYGRRSHAHEHVAALFTDWVVPVCSPALIASGAPNCPEDILTFPLLNVEWEADYKASPQWKDWASLINADGQQTFSGLSFTLSSSAIDAAANGRGGVLAQVSKVQDEIAAGSLIVPFDIRMKLSESYYLAGTGPPSKSRSASGSTNGLLALRDSRINNPRQPFQLASCHCLEWLN